MSSSRTFKNRPVFARFYAALSRGMEKRGVGEHRRALLDGLQGRVVEVGAGNGYNFAHYPAGVTEVLAIEPEPHLRGMAVHRSAAAPVPVRVLAGTAEHIPAADGEFDAAVVSLVLCSVPDQALALREIHRVLRPAGELRFYEHVISRDPRFARFQKLIDATFWPLIAGGCHAARDTGAAIPAAGFEIVRQRRFAFKAGALQPAVPHVLGVARRI